MPTLKKIATQVIDRLNVPYNDALYQDVKDRIIHYTNLFLKRRLDKLRLDERYILGYSIDIKQVSELSIKNINFPLGAKAVDYKIYKSVNSIPTLIDTVRPAPFLSAYIPSSDITKDILVYVDRSLIGDYYKSRLTYGHSIYTFNGKELIVVTEKTISNVIIEDIFEYPMIITNDYNIYNVGGIIFDDEAEFPIDSNLIPVVIDELTKHFNGDSRNNIPTED